MSGKYVRLVEEANQTPKDEQDLFHKYQTLTEKYHSGTLTDNELEEFDYLKSVFSESNEELEESACEKCDCDPCECEEVKEENCCETCGNDPCTCEDVKEENEEELEEARDGKVSLDKGHVALAKKKLASGRKTLDAYLERLKKNELSVKLGDSGQEWYISSLKKAIGLKEETETEELEESERFKANGKVKGSLISVYYSDFGVDSLSAFGKQKLKNVTAVTDPKETIGKKGDFVIVVDGPYGIGWAKPVVDGKVINGMFGGAFIYSSNSAKFKYSDPVRLMDRVEK